MKNLKLSLVLAGLAATLNFASAQEEDRVIERIVVATMGIRPTLGPTIVFSGATRVAGRMVVDVIATEVCGSLTAIATPADVARIPRLSGELEFRVEHVGNPCK